MATKPTRKFGAVQLGSDNVLLRRFAPYILYGLITLLIVVLYLDDHRLFASWELGIQDMMVSMGRRPDPPEEVVIVNIDNNAVAKLGPWPWNAERVGYLVGMLGEYKPRAIGLDLELPTEFMEDPAGNQFLTEMITGAGNVVLPVRFTLSETGRMDRPVPDFVGRSSIVVVDEAARLLDCPYPQSSGISFPFPEACKAAAGVGHVNTWQDVDGSVRRDPLVVNYGGEYYPSMALQLARIASGLHRAQMHIEPGEAVTLAMKSIPTDESGMFHIDFRGPTGTVPSVSAARVLEGDADRTLLTGRIVIVGVSAAGYGTELRTSGSPAMPRAEKIATVTANILSDRYITTVSLSAFLDLLILIGIGAFCAVVMPSVNLTNRIVILVVMGFLFLNLNYVLFHSFKLITKTLYPTLEILLFLAFAPMVKYRPEKKAGTAGAAAVAAATGSAKSRASSSRRTPATQVDAEGVPIRHVREGDSKSGVITGLAGTIMMESSPSAATVSAQPARPTTKSGKIMLAPSFEPTQTEEIGPAAQPRDLMAESPRPMGLDDRGTLDKQLGLQPIVASDVNCLGRYEILGVLGQGAMGTVYKGRDPAIDRPVALKTIRVGEGADPERAAELRDRLVREAKAAGKLSHPNIVTIYDVGAEGDLDYIAMEYLEGYTLEQIVRKEVALNYRIAAKMLIQVCQALDYAHRAGIVHRDIKPANIMVLENFNIKVTDFGIARFESSGMSMTQTGIAVGTPYYIAPEQLRGGPIDRRCDIFSLGVVAYELLTRKRPFTGENLTSLIYAITQTNPPLPSKVDASIPSLFDVIIGKALAKDPRERYQTAEEMCNQLAAFIDDMAPAKAFRI